MLESGDEATDGILDTKFSPDVKSALAINSSWLKDQGSGILAHSFSCIFMSNGHSLQGRLAARFGVSGQQAKKRAHANSSHDESAPSLGGSVAKKDFQDVGSAEESDQQHLARHGKLRKQCARCRLAGQLFWSITFFWIQLSCFKKRTHFHLFL